MGKPSAEELTRAIRQKALALGFAAVGVAPAVTPQGISRFYRWLAQGYAGQMHYLTDRAEAYAHPRFVLQGVRSLVVLAQPYRTQEPQTPKPTQGRVSRYAWGVDYHRTVRRKLRQLVRLVKQLADPCQVRGVVDTAPLLERDFAQLAGLGWQGKNTLVLNRQLGSWFFLAVLLTDQELIYDPPTEKGHCGTCRACLDACPTQAFVAPGVLDSRRCISYLTIELRGPIPRELRSGLGQWVFGCDVCQEVCPWNRKAPTTPEPEFAPLPGMNPLELLELFELNEEGFRRRFGHTPLARPGREGMLRNAAVVLGNQRCEEAVPVLAQALKREGPVVREACVWALGQIATSEALQVLRQHALVETHPRVQAELQTVLNEKAGQRADPPAPWTPEPMTEPVPRAIDSHSTGANCEDKSWPN